MTDLLNKKRGNPMSDQYVGEIRMFSGNYAPQDWHFCDGTLLPISQYAALYSLIGTVYGGDGVNSFALPDLRGRIPVHISSANPNITLGQKAGVENVTLLQTQLPVHTHQANANNVAADASSSSPEGQFWGVSTGITNYLNKAPDVTMSLSSVSVVGGNQSHNNMMPSHTVSFIIAINGIYPSQG